ncbi:MAG: orotate phosphoribosyltransferase [Actinomycetota bacterium]|nr:orotate phosphoribosyltransferase [Actinomycetota bacterium]
MNEAEVLEVLEGSGALRRGHFLLSSGKHSDVYVEKARVFEAAALTGSLGDEIASWHPGLRAVVSPAVGALPLGFAVALAASGRFLYAERVDGRMTLRRGFELTDGEPTLVVEDVVTTGGSAAEVHGLVVESGARALGVAALVDRSNGDLSFPLRALARVPAEAWDASTCPLCAGGGTPESPGSRHLG